MSAKTYIFWFFFLGMSLALPRPEARAQSSRSILQWVRAGKIHQAKILYKKEASSHPFSENQILALSDSLEALNQVPLALDFLDLWRARHAISRKVEERFADLALEANQLKRAIAAYKKLTQKYPKIRAYWLQLAKVALWDENQSLALKAYQKAVALNPKDVQTLRQLAKLYSWTNQDEKAYQIQSLILRYDPSDVALWKEHGIQARWLGKNQEAIEAFKNVLLRNPKDAEAFFLLGETYLWTDQQDKARLCFKETLKLNPNNLKARFYWAQIRQWEPFGWWEARENYRLILKSDPQNKQVRKYLTMIRKNYGPLLGTTAQYIHDSNDLRRTEIRVHGERFFSARWQIRADGLLNRLEENKPTGHFVVAGQGAELRVLWNVCQGTRFIGTGGWIQYAVRQGFPLAKLQWQQRVFERPHWPGQLYTSLSLIRDQVLDGVLAVKNRDTANRGKWSLYWQPDSAFHAGSDFQHSWYSDGNEKTQLYVTAEWRFFTVSPVDFFLTGLFAYENMKKIYPNAMPYWTPHNFRTYSAGPALKWQPLSTLWLRTDFAFTRQTGNGQAFNYKLWLDWRPNPFGTGYVLFQSYGSKYYSYKMARLGFSYRF